MAVIDFNNIVKPKSIYKNDTLVSRVFENTLPTYVDLHLDITQSLNVGLGDNPANVNDILIDYDLDAIKNSLRNIFTTKKGQKILNPQFGCSLEQFLFSPISEAGAKVIAKEILNGVERFEPRIQINNIFVNPLPDDLLYKISIYYTLLEIKKQNIINILAYLGGQFTLQ
jgi:phage baseplate assembly protein W